eukprot:TRINITY_DN5732_c0_g1_i11.p1 TRINITY_DN5732_c0_g1~~TRINITY_DN5732_c0_g1_i11.p1  ORF type:complete len:288 (+),score=23.81 TRINITY_DN5732_c0_g1_i11:85-948(+)
MNMKKLLTSRVQDMVLKETGAVGAGVKWRVLRPEVPCFEKDQGKYYQGKVMGNSKDVRKKYGFPPGLEPFTKVVKDDIRLEWPKFKKWSKSQMDETSAFKILKYFSDQKKLRGAKVVIESEEEGIKIEGIGGRCPAGVIYRFTVTNKRKEKVRLMARSLEFFGSTSKDDIPQRVLGFSLHDIPWSIGVVGETPRLGPNECCTWQSGVPQHQQRLNHISEMKGVLRFIIEPKEGSPPEKGFRSAEDFYIGVMNSAKHTFEVQLPRIKFSEDTPVITRGQESDSKRPDP